MATIEAPESLGQMGRQVADDAVRLVRAELAVVKAEAVESLWGVLGVVLALVGAGLSLLFFLMFTVGTMDEGLTVGDNWAMGLAIAAVILAAVSAVFAAKSGWTFFWVLAGLLLLGFVGLTVTFFVIIFFASGPEAARKGWAISAAVFFAAMVVCIAAAGALAWRLKGGITGAYKSLKEDVTWATQLTKRNANEN